MVPRAPASFDENSLPVGGHLNQEPAMSIETTRAELGLPDGFKGQAIRPA